MILSLDANFRLSNKLTRSTNKTDPNLTDGKAYMPPRKDYSVYLKQNEGEMVDVVRLVCNRDLERARLINLSQATVHALELYTWPTRREDIRGFGQQG